MIRFLKRYHKQLFGLLVLAIFVVYFVRNIDSFKILLDIRPIFLVGVAVCYVAIVYTNGLFIKYVIEPFNKKISVRESVRVSLISSLGNFFASSGAGLGFRAVYLKKKHGLSYGDYMTTMYGNYLLFFIINAVLGLISLLLISSKDSVQYKGAFLFFAGLLVVSLVLCFVPIPKLFAGSVKNKYVTSILGFIQKMTEGWSRIVKNRRLLMHLTILVSIQLVLTILIGWLEISSLHIVIGFPELLLFSVLGSMSIFISLTPGNLGVKEGIYILTASVIGLTTPQIVSIALIDRGILFGTLFVLWLLFGSSKTRQSLKSPSASIDNFSDVSIPTGIPPSHKINSELPIEEFMKERVSHETKFGRGEKMKTELR